MDPGGPKTCGSGFGSGTLPVALEGPGVVALLLSLHAELVLEVLVGGQLALHLYTSASLQSHLHSEYCREDRFTSVL